MTDPERALLRLLTKCVLELQQWNETIPFLEEHRAELAQALEEVEHDPA